MDDTGLVVDESRTLETTLAKHSLALHSSLRILEARHTTQSTAGSTVYSSDARRAHSRSQSTTNQPSAVVSVRHGLSTHKEATRSK